MMAFKKWRKQHFLLCDVMLVTSVVSVAGAFAYVLVPTEHLVGVLQGIRPTLYGTAATACAALLGFVLTIGTITDAVMQSAKWEDFRQSLDYSEVQDIYFDTIRWLGFGTLLFLVFLIADTDAHPLLPCEAISAWLVCLLVIRMWRGIDALETLLRMNSFKVKRLRSSRRI